MSLQNEVKEIKQYRNGRIYNKNQNKYYNLKKYIEIEFFNGSIILLDLISNTDITNSDYLEITNKGKLSKTIFRNIFTNFISK